MGVANIHEAETQLSKLIERALNGEDVIIAESGRPLVRLVPIQADLTPRQGGQWRGRVLIHPDFDTLPEDVATAFGIDTP